MGWSEKDFCIKCDKGGKVLPCSDSSCPISVHENCLGFPAKFDDIGNFYCPYCSYKRATEESRWAREKTLMRKQALSTFINLDIINGDKRIDERNSEQKELGKMQNTGKSNHCHDGINENKLGEASIQKNPVQHKDGQEEESSPESTRSVALHKETDVVLLGKKNSASCTKYGDSARLSKCNDRLVVVGYQTPSGPIVACGDNDVYSEEEETVHHFQMTEIGRHVLLKHHKQLNDDQPARTVENHTEDSHFGDVPVEENQERENFSSSAKSVDNNADPIEDDKDKNEVEEMKEQVQESNSSFGTDLATPVPLEEKGGLGSADTLCGESDATTARKRVKINDKTSSHPADVNRLGRSCQISSSALTAKREKIEEQNAPTGLKHVTELSPEFSRNLLPSERRKKLPWTDDEEKMLGEGVCMYSTTKNKSIPWRKIFEFGRHVFHDTRTPVDLKDKWKNMKIFEFARHVFHDTRTPVDLKDKWRNVLAKRNIKC